MTVGIVLAGGRSSRFGRDKLRVAMADGRPLLAHAATPFLAVCSTVVVVSGPGGVLADGLSPRLVFVSDQEAHGGPVVGLAAGLEALAAAADEIVLLAAGDMPSMHEDVLRLLAETLASTQDVDCARLEIESTALTGSMAVMPCAVRRAAAIEAAASSLGEGDRRLRGVLGRLRTAVVPAASWRRRDPGAGSLRDIDLPGDLDLAVDLPADA